MTDNPAIMGPLNELIEQARHEGKWLWCRYQDLWFSPDKLEAANKNGQFRWGVVNWKLRDPNERLQEAEDRLDDARRERNRIAAEIK
jgi:hypothetical protein